MTWDRRERQEAILRELSDVRAGLGRDETPAEESRARKQPPRDAPAVGVFVDVQNMFYGARERGARLDFEALLAAASSGRLASARARSASAR